MKFLCNSIWISIDRGNPLSYNTDRLLNERFNKKFYDRYRGPDQASSPDQRPLPGRSRRARGPHQGSDLADRAEPGPPGGDPVGEGNPARTGARGGKLRVHPFREAGPSAGKGDLHRPKGGKPLLPRGAGVRVFEQGEESGRLPLGQGERRGTPQ